MRFLNAWIPLISVTLIKRLHLGHLKSSCASYSPSVFMMRYPHLGHVTGKEVVIIRVTTFWIGMLES